MWSTNDTNICIPWNYGHEFVGWLEAGHGNAYATPSSKEDETLFQEVTKEKMDRGTVFEHQTLK